MAVSIANLEHAAGSSSGAAKSNTSRDKPNAGDGFQFRVESFVQDSGMTHEMRDKSGRQKDAKREWTNLSGETRANYSKFLVDYVSKIGEAYDKLPELFKDTGIGKELNEFTADFEIFKILAGKKDTGAFNVKFEGAQLDALRSRIDNFLNSPRGYILSTLAMERQTEREAFALGVLPKTNPEPREDDTDLPSTKTPLNMGEGPIGYPVRKAQEFMSEKTGSFDRRKGQVAILGSIVLPDIPMVPGIRRVKGIPVPTLTRWHDQNRAQTGLLLVGAGVVVAATSAATLGLAPGFAAATGFIPTAAEAFALAIGKGVSRDYEKPDVAAKALQYIKADKNRADYMKIMTKVDVFNPQATPVSRETLRYNVDEKIEARKAAITSFGGDRAYMDALGAGFLFNPDGKGYPEKTALKYAISVAEKFKADEGGVLDINGNARKIRNAAGDWVDNNAANNPNPATQFDAAHLDYVGNLERFDKARREVMMDVLKEYTEGEMKRGVDKPKWQEKIKAMTEAEGSFRKARTEKATKDKTKLETYKEKAVAEKTNLESYSNAVEQLSTDRKDLDKELTDTLSSAFPDVDAALAALRSVKTTYGVTINIDSKTISSTHQREIELEVWKKDEYDQVAEDTPIRTGEEPEDHKIRVAQARAVVDVEYKNRLAKIQEDTAKVDALIKKLDGYKTSIKDKEKALESDQEKPKALREQLSSWKRSYNEITSPTWNTGGPGNELDQTTLSSGDVDEIFRRINLIYDTALAAGTPNPPGWPEQRNSDPAYRERVIKAVLEARARSSETSDYRDFTNLGMWGFTDEELSTMSITDLTTEAGARATRLGLPGFSVSQIENAVRDAKNRVALRSGVIDEFIAETDRKIEDKRFEIEGTKFDDEVKQLEVTKDLIGNFDRIVDNAGDVVREEDKYTDGTKLTATDTNYSEAERTAGKEKGYYQFLDLMFDYKEKTDRADYFNKISKVVTPEKLMEIMTPLLMAPPMVMPTDFGTFLSALKTEIGNKRVKDREIRNAFFSVMRYYVDEAEAM